MTQSTIFYLQSLVFILLGFGSWHFTARLYGSIVNTLCSVVTLILSVTTLQVRYSPMGKICAANDAPVDYMFNGQFDNSGRTYVNDAELLGALAIFGIVLMCL